ncbi:MAG: hypothetical protein U1F34_04555 [Gammaproteobacteria bacterium]
MSNMSTSVIPAHPGWFMAMPDHDGDPQSPIRSIKWDAVIGWIVVHGCDPTSGAMHGHWTFPLTALPSVRMPAGIVLRRPDNQIFAEDCPSFDNEADVVSYLERKRRDDSPI